MISKTSREFMLLHEKKSPYMIDVTKHNIGFIITQVTQDINLASGILSKSICSYLNAFCITY